MKVAIHVDQGYSHSTSWSVPWVEFCENNGVEYEAVDCYSAEFRNRLDLFDVLLWHFSHYSERDMVFARSIISAARAKGLRVFPDYSDSWHFDDKVAQDFILNALGVSVPSSHCFFDMDSLCSWELDNAPKYPMVAKLRRGSGSHNVVLIESKEKLFSYAYSMFGKGVSSKPKVIYKVISNLLSVKSFSDFWSRLRRAPDFVSTLRKSSSLKKERGYVYLQDFIVNDGFDLKIVVIGDKLSFIARRNRAGDFRASGGGGIFFDRMLVSDDVIDLCFSASDKLSSLCMGYDVVIDSKSGTPYIIEMSYGFSHHALLAAGGYWGRDRIWHETALDAPVEVISSILGGCNAGATNS